MSFAEVPIYVPPLVISSNIYGILTIFVKDAVGLLLELLLGIKVGEVVGISVGVKLGTIVGVMVGKAVGTFVGAAVGVRLMFVKSYFTKFTTFN